MWHVSVSVGGKPRTVWSDETVRRARKLCRKLLAGVGGEEFWKPGNICEHYRKLMTPEEIKMLDPKWLSLPAIDEAG